MQAARGGAIEKAAEVAGGVHGAHPHQQAADDGGQTVADPHRGEGAATAQTARQHGPQNTEPEHADHGVDKERLGQFRVPLEQAKQGGTAQRHVIDGAGDGPGRAVQSDYGRVKQGDDDAAGQHGEAAIAPEQVAAAEEGLELAGALEFAVAKQQEQRGDQRQIEQHAAPDIAGQIPGQYHMAGEGGLQFGAELVADEGADAVADQHQPEAGLPLAAAVKSAGGADASQLHADAEQEGTDDERNADSHHVTHHGIAKQGVAKGEEGGEQQNFDGDGEQVNPHVVAVALGQHFAPTEYDAEATEGEGEAEAESDQGHQSPFHTKGVAKPE